MKRNIQLVKDNFNELFFSNNYFSQLEISEIVAVILDLKLVVRFLISDVKIDKIKKIFEKIDLFFEVSDFKILFDLKYPYSYIQVKKEDNRTPFYYGYISKSIDYIEKAKEYDTMLVNYEKGNTDLNFEIVEKLGLLFGYPKCCIDFLINLRGKNIIHYAKKAYNNTNVKPNFYTFYFDFYTSYQYKLISHYPCSFDCKNTIEYGKKIFEEINEINSEYARILKNKLMKIVLYFEVGEGILLTCKFNRNKISYSECNILSNNKKHNLFSQGNKIKILDNRIIVYKNNVPLIAFMKPLIIDFTK